MSVVSRQAPAVWGKVPPRLKNFTGREESLGKLRASIASQPTAVVPHALHGLGGVGKTQLAAEYAHRHRDEYDLVWWIPADQPVLVRSSLAGLAPYLDVPPASSSGIEDAANAVLDALRRGEPYARWLLVFDNADQPEDLLELLPQGTGHVLITSRNHRWEGVVDTLAINVFDRAESVEFLTKRVPQAISREEAERLAHELGDLPLALEQAGALQAETGMSVEEYLGLLTERTSQLLSEGKPSEYPVSMTAAWAISVESLKGKMPDALYLLRCCAFFGPEPIPRDAFTQVRPEVRAQLGPELQTLIADPIATSKAVGELGRFALARLDIPGRTLQIHRLIQALLREGLSQDEQQVLQHEVHVLLAAYAPDDPDDQKNWERFQNLLGHVEPAGVRFCDAPAVRQMALNVVRYLFSSGNLVSQRTFAEEFLQTWSTRSGEDHEDVLSMALEYGNLLRELGRYGEAAQYNEQWLIKAEKSVGPDHELTLRFLRGRPADLRASGNFRRALEVGEQALERCQQRFGDEDRATIRALNNLALDYGLSSRYQKAKELHKRAYMGSSALDQSSMANAWTGLARAVRLCGDYAEAADIGQDAHAFALSTIGADHPWTLRAAKDLSVAWRRLGDLEGALELATSTHARLVSLYGLDHPDTLSAAMGLANVLRTMGEAQQALDLAADTVRRYPRVYGPQHPYNHGCIGNLAIMRRVIGDPEDARRLNEEALEGLDRSLGRDHHYTLTVTTNLASDLALLGELESAVRLGRGTLRRLSALLGGEHPMALLCAANLSADLLAFGEQEEAAELYEGTKSAYARTLGLDHPDVRVFLDGRHLDADFDPPPI
ncbi:FxSxx-COOH system tetratricopeptide repeat protein [Actinocorallia sp. API 0066]|uniref:FxSxx-COOH system tetratricopeptide repeat protein n=1 Tax=Actinocorallia sp. API 0066 TaxID=2896846 RepID=UPI001E59B81E|nr:FxSxx-COOH system tetratricopeptide repeat protein [Actinocorallia sp. API 0066]MCD0452387.1 FxSxx-COOH system tetratricopeptide repeat protein [Actinocorallia sp. API 0066]